MAEPTKDKEYILANQEDFKAALERAREYFKKFDGVVGVGFGQKHSGNAYKDNISIIISVNEKKNEEDIPVEQRIPKSFEGFPTDVVVVLNLSPGVCDNTGEYNKIRGGIQICPQASGNLISEGTLGCIVRKKNDSGRENVHLLTNKHVLYSSGGTAGGYVYHPFPPPPPDAISSRASNSLGPIAALSFYGDVSYTPPGASTPGTFFIDCGTARINIDSKCLGSTCTKDTTEYEESIIDLQVNAVNTISDVRNIIGDLSMIGEWVFKVGRTTGKTRGIVRRVDIAGTMPIDFNNPSSPTMNVSNVISIDFDPAYETGVNCKGNAFFGEHGDSGSLVVDIQNKAVGLLYGVPLPGATGAAPCGACHIFPVLEKLGICIPTTAGTTPYNCRATDSTGLTPAPTVGTGSGGGALGVTAATARINSGNDAGFLQPEPLTEAQQERLTALLDAFRSTARGRELHAAFALVRREVGYLVRNCRPVMVAWHRNKGPGFFACFLNHLRGDLNEFPHRIGEHKLSVLLDKMEAQMMSHGSIPLKETLQLYGEQIRLMLLGGNDVRDFINQLEKMESE